MTRMLRLWPEGQSRREDQVEVSAELEDLRGKRTRLYFRLPAEERASLTSADDPFVLAVAFHALSAGADLEVHGTLSPSLLRGLEEFQIAWCRWRPDRYGRFEVRAEAEREQTRAASDKTVLAFSGGLDSCGTAWRHTRGEMGRRRRTLASAVMVHGFDIPLQQDDVFASAVDSSRAMMDDIGVPLVPMKCNARQLRGKWEDQHGAALAACLHLLGGGYSTGLIASSHVYDGLRFPWGSNALTDPMLSSDAFAIVHDGCDLTRWEKADVVAEWGAAQRHLRVCWQGEHLDRNCGVCVRCVGTAFCFAVMGRPIPSALAVPSPEEGVRRLSALEPNPIQLRHLANMAATARRKGIGDLWVAELEQLAPVPPDPERSKPGTLGGLRNRLRKLTGRS